MMADQETHMIGNLVFEIDLDDERSFPFLSTQLRKVVAERLPEAMESAFDSLLPDGMTIRIPKLEIDLGDINAEGFEEILLWKFVEALTRELASLLDIPEALAAQTLPHQSFAEADRLLQLVTHFVRYGHRPWWARRTSPELERAFQEIIRVRRSPTRSMVLEEGKIAPSRQRIIYSFSDPTLYSLFSILSPEPESFFREYIEEFQVVHRAEKVVREEDRKFRKVIQELILMYLIDLSASGIDQVGFLEFQMRRLGRRYQIPFPVLVRRFRDVVRRLSGQQLPEKGVLLPIAEALYLQVFPEESALISGERELQPIHLEAGAVKQLRDLFLSGSTNLPVRRRIHQDKDRFLRWMIAEREPVFKRILFDLGRDALVRRRILAIFKEESIRRVFESLAPGKLELLYAAFELFEVATEAPNPPQQERTAFRKSVQSIALQLLIEQQGRRVADERYIESLLTMFARQYNIRRERLLELLLAELAERTALSVGMQVLGRTLHLIDQHPSFHSEQQVSPRASSPQQGSKDVPAAIRPDTQDFHPDFSINTPSTVQSQQGATQGFPVQLLLKALTSGIDAAQQTALLHRMLLVLKSVGLLTGQELSPRTISILLDTMIRTADWSDRLAEALGIIINLLGLETSQVTRQLEQAFTPSLLKMTPDSGPLLRKFFSQLNTRRRADKTTLIGWMEALRLSPPEAASLIIRQKLTSDLSASQSKRVLKLIAPTKYELYEQLVNKLIEQGVETPVQQSFLHQELRVLVIRYALRRPTGAAGDLRLARLLVEHLNNESESSVADLDPLQQRLSKDTSALGELLHRAVAIVSKKRQTGIVPPPRPATSSRRLTLTYLLDLWGEEIWGQWVPDAEAQAPEDVLQTLLREAPEAFREFLLRHRFSALLPALLAEHLPETLWTDILPVISPENHADLHSVEQTFLYWYTAYRMVRMPASVFRPFVRTHLLEYAMQSADARFDARSATVHIYDTLYRRGKLDLQELARLPEAVYLTDAKLRPRDVWSSFLFASPALPLSQQRRSKQFYHDILLSFLEQGSVPAWASELELGTELLSEIFQKMLRERSPLLAVRMRELRFSQPMIRRLNQLIREDDYRMVIELIDDDPRQRSLLAAYDRWIAQAVSADAKLDSQTSRRRLTETILTGQLWLLGPTVLENPAFARQFLSSIFPNLSMSSGMVKGAQGVQEFLASLQSGSPLPEPGDREFEMLAGLLKTTLQSGRWPAMLQSGGLGAIKELLATMARNRPGHLLFLFRLSNPGITYHQELLNLLPQDLRERWLTSSMQDFIPGELSTLLLTIGKELGQAARQQMERLTLSELLLPERLSGRAYARFFRQLGEAVPTAARLLTENAPLRTLLQKYRDLPWVPAARLLAQSAEATAGSAYLLPSQLAVEWDLVNYYLQYGSASPAFGSVDVPRIVEAVDKLNTRAYHFFRRQAYGLARHPFSRRLLISLLNKGTGGGTKGFNLIHPSMSEHLKILQKLVGKTYPDYPLLKVLGLEAPATLLDYLLRLWTASSFFLFTPSSLIRHLLTEYSQILKIPLRVMLSELEQQADWSDRTILKSPGKDSGFIRPTENETTEKGTPERKIIADDTGQKPEPPENDSTPRQLENNEDPGRRDSGAAAERAGESPASSVQKDQPLGATEKEQEAALVREILDLEDAAEAAKSVQEEQREDATPAQQPEEEGIYVPNAGLCLLWPFLGRLFRRLNMMEGNNFIDEETRIRAILLTNYLTTGRTTADLAGLTLNKIFCGAEPGYVIDREELNISAEEEALVESLLKGAIYNWEKVRGTRVETFRETFLQRDGVVRKDGKRWILTVETKAYDLLLMTLPWNLGIIKTAWMTAPLEVIWEHGGTKL